MGNEKREIFVFVGQNASTGTPHPVTGMRSFYGTIYRIDGTLKQAREFADSEYDAYSTILCIPGGRRKMREYCLGTSVRVFDEYLQECPTVFPDNNEPVENWHIG